MYRLSPSIDVILIAGRMRLYSLDKLRWPLAEEFRGMTRQAQIFRVRYIGYSGIIKEVEIAAPNTGEAIRTAREAVWPPKAVALRLVDTLGREVFEEQKAALR